MSYVRKMGAPALVIAAAFAVAFAVLVSSTAEATVQTRVGTTFTDVTAVNGAAPASNGDTVYVENTNDGFTTFEISTTGAASASFTHGDASDDGQSITCAPAAATATGTCDANPAEAGSTVAVKIDDDSGAGVVFVKQTIVTGGGTAATDAIRVTVAQVPTRISLKAASTTINSDEDATDASTTIDIRLIDEIGGGIANEDLTVVSTHAVLSAVVSGTKDALNNSL